MPLISTTIGVAPLRQDFESVFVAHFFGIGVGVENQAVDVIFGELADDIDYFGITNIPDIPMRTLT